MSTLRTRHDAADGLVDRAAMAFTDFRDGDHARMGDLVDLLTPILWHAARAQGVEAVAAEDAVQRAWLTLVEHADRIREPRAVLGWLLTTVRRDARRRRSLATRTAALEGRPEPPDRDPPPDAVAVLDDRQAILWAHVRRLSERCRQLLRVVAFADRPDYRAISEALGMPVGSIGPTRGRCLDKLRRSLARDEHWEGYGR